MQAIALMHKKNVDELLAAGLPLEPQFDSEGRLQTFTLDIRAARLDDEWIGVPKVWPTTCSAHHPDEHTMTLMVQNAVMGWIEERLSGRRVANFRQTLQYPLREYSNTLLRTN